MHANNYQGIPAKDQRIWNQSQHFYETISQATALPLVGGFLFSLFDKWQEIKQFYPKRDLSSPNFQTKQTYGLINKGWGKNLIETLNEDPKPLVTTFFVPAFMAEEHDYRGEIYCIICDTDIARNWAPLNPVSSRIQYLVPTSRAVERLQLYGVKSKNIFLTGFPLPKENIGGRDIKMIKTDLAVRIANLDPARRFIDNYASVLRENIGEQVFRHDADVRVRLTFAVGGAGAQKKLGGAILESLREKIKRRALRLNLIAGTRNDVYRYFCSVIDSLGLKRHLHKDIEIIYDETKTGYFEKFNTVLRATDILWTKPSELSFYCALGIPIIIAPPIGSQEVFNHKWLVSIGSGIDQEDPRYTNEWLFDWLDSGWLAEAAYHGFIDAPKLGTYNIEEVVLGQRTHKEGRVELL